VAALNLIVDRLEGRARQQIEVADTSRSSYATGRTTSASILSMVTGRKKNLPKHQVAPTKPLHSTAVRRPMSLRGFVFHRTDYSGMVAHSHKGMMKLGLPRLVEAPCDWGTLN